MAGITFGQMIRAARLGFGRWQNGYVWVWVRISGHPSGFLVEIRNEVSGSLKPIEHYVWWKGSDPFAQSPYMQGLREVTEPLAVVLDENGDLSPIEVKE